MSPDAARAMLRRFIEADASTVVIRRYSGPASASRPSAEWTGGARVMGFQPDEIIGGISAGERKVILSAEDLEDANFPLPLLATDKIVVRGKELAIKRLDDETRRLQGTLIAYELVVG